jgi:hypothetical protein
MPIPKVNPEHKVCNNLMEIRSDPCEVGVLYRGCSGDLRESVGLLVSVRRN